LPAHVVGRFRWQRLLASLASRPPRPPPPLPFRPASWLLEELSTSTRTNALRSLEIIQAHGQQKQGQRWGQERRLQGDEEEAGGSGGSGGGDPQGAWRAVVLVTNPFHQLRSYLTFRRAMAEIGMEPGGPGGYALYVADAPFAGHAGYGPALDALADQWDFWRELAALAWYWARGYL
jgi:hypothetical protein